MTGKFNFECMDFCLCPIYSALFFVFPTFFFFPNYFAVQFSPEYDSSRVEKKKGSYLVADSKFWKSLLK